MVIPPAGGRDGGSGTAGGGYLCLPPPEHGCTEHCNQTHYEPVSGGVADTVSKGIQAVLRTGRSGCGRDADGGSGGRRDGGGLGDGQDGDGNGLNWWEDNVANVNLGTKPKSPLAYALGL